MEEIKNKRITREVIYNIAALIYEYYSELNNLYKEYKDITARYDNPEGDVVKPIVVRSNPSFTIDIGMENQNETIDDLQGLKYYLDNMSSKLNKVSIHMNAYYNVNATCNSFSSDNRVYEGISITFREDDIYTKFDFENSRREFHSLRNKVEGMLHNSPVSYDKIISNKYFRKNIPSLSIGLLLGLIVTFALYLYGKQEGVNEMIAKVVNFKYYVPVMLGASIFVGLIIPGKNHRLYSAMNIKRRYAGWTRSSGEIYKDDLRAFLNCCEVEIGKYHNRGKLRIAIEETYNSAKKFVLIELLIFVALFFVL